MTTPRVRTRKPRTVRVNPAVPAPKIIVTPATPPKSARATKPKAPKAEKTPKPPTVKQLEAQARRDQYETELLFQMRALRLSAEPQQQALWHPTVNYKADFLFVRERLIVEVDGGVYLRHGHHNSGKGYEYDRVRDAEALTLGYTVLRVTPGMVKDGSAVSYVERVLHAIWARNKRTA